MPAIFGFIGQCDESLIAAMGERLAHKGPCIETWSPADNVWLGEARHWPRSENECPGTASCLQTELNWPDFPNESCDSLAKRDRLRRNQLSAFLEHDASDAAVRLDGMFAFAHWIPSSRQLLLAVDRSGYERLYYTQTNAGIAFASDYKALLAFPEVSISPNPDAIQYALSVSKIDTLATMAAGINRVPQAHMLLLGDSHNKPEPYWQGKSDPKHSSLDDAARKLRDVLVDQLKRSLWPFEEFALTLSGGLDSPGLLALMRHVDPRKKISTYTIGYSEDDPEITGAREAASYFETNHHELYFDPNSIVDELPRAIWMAEELAGREEILLQLQVERHLLSQQRVLVAGHGADMVFAGMPRHRLIRMAEKIPLANTALTELYQQTQTGLPPSSVPGKLASRMLYRGKNVVPPLVNGSSGPTRVPDPGTLETYIEQTVYDMPEYHSHSATHAAIPMENITPYLSNAVVDFGFTLPARMKSSTRQQKIVLRRALAPILPADIQRRGKAIQRIRHDRALTEVLDGIAENVLDPSSISERGLVPADYVGALRNKGSGGVYSGDQLKRLWMLIVTELWCRTFVDSRAETPVSI